MESKGTITTQEIHALSEFFRRKLEACHDQEPASLVIGRTIGSYVCAPIICLADLQSQGEDYKGLIAEYVRGAIASLEAINKAAQAGELDMRRQFQ